MNTKRKNPTRPLRSGFAYQEIWSLFLCAKWLFEPEKFKWIKFETVPDESEDNRFYLDDIILLTQDDRYHLYQVKHTENSSGDYWTWEKLLKREPGKRVPLKDSLIQKWFESYFKEGLVGNIEYAALVTNGLAAPDLNSFITDGVIDIARVEAEQGDIYVRLCEQLVDKDKIQQFFSNFRFLFGQKDIEELEEEARAIFYNNFKATEDGVTNLLFGIQKESRKQNPSEWTLNHVIQLCEFDVPKHLNESFIIPADFELFDEARHEKLLADLQGKEGGIKVIYGKPGSGKSTYISKLHQTLTNEKNVVSIRHHYYIAPQDPSPQERLNSTRVVEAIKAQFKEYSEELEDLAIQNSAGVSLKTFIGKLAEHFYTRDRAFVLIVDGLDHVLRYSEPGELKDLIAEICYPQPGLWIVFGTQEAAKEYLPTIVFEKCPEEEWLEIDGFGKQAVVNIITKNIIGLNLPEQEDRLEKLNEAIFQITEGNPLHIRYTLSDLKTRLDNALVTEYECQNLLPYGGEISQYYASLWGQVSEPGKTVAVTISCAGFHFSEEQLFDLVGSMESSPTDISEGYKSILHLLSSDRRGIFIYHNSFELFVLDTPEFTQQQNAIKTGMKDWLEQSEYEELKWSELKILAYSLGYPQPILGIDRNWLVEAISFPRDPEKIISHLDLGAKAAFENNKYGIVFELANLREYFQNAVNYMEEEYERVWEHAFYESSRSISGMDLQTLSSRQIRIVSQKAESLGISGIIDDAIEIFNDRHRNLSIHKNGEIGSQIPQLPADLLQIVSLDRSHQVRRIQEYVARFGESGWTEDLFSKYVNTLLKTGQLLKIHELLSFELTASERQKILTDCAIFDLKSGESHFLDIVSAEDNGSLSYKCLLYLIWHDKPIDYIPPLPAYEIFPVTVPEYETGKRAERAKLFSDNFVLGMVYGLLGKQSEVQDWINGIGDRWALRIMAEILRSSIDLTTQLKEDKTISFTTLFTNISRVTPLNWLESRDLYELQICLRLSLNSILKVIYSFKCSTELPPSCDNEEFNQITSTEYFDKENFLQFLLALDKPLLSAESYEVYITEEQVRWKGFVTHFSERTEHYTDLAKLASIHKDNERRISFLKLAASNLVGYGYHKDIFLDGVLETLEICSELGSTKVAEWINRIAPIVENVTDYTDGDETRHFPPQLAEILVKIHPGMLFKYYYQKAEDEDLFLAQDIFKYVLRCLDFNNPVNIALAGTAVEKESFLELKSIADGNPKADEALKSMEDYFGHIEYPKEEESQHDSGIEKEEPDYSKVQPDELEKHLAKYDTRWDKREYLISWVKDWLGQERSGRDTIYPVLAAIAEGDGLYNADSAFLDFLYPLAYEFDSNKAFEYLCWAQANEHGWERYWTYKYKAEARWDFIKNHYRARYLEFFEKSTVSSGVWAGRGGKYNIPIPRGIEYLALFKNLDEIEEIVEAAVKFTESLMAGLELPECKWTKSADLDELDILMQRLLWPSPTVRERAAVGIARLLNSDQNGDAVFQRLLNWISNQKLETTVAIGLLPLLKTAEKGNRGVYFFDINLVAEAVPISSIVIQHLLEELARLLDETLEFVDKSAKISVVPDTYNPDVFFFRYISSFLAPIYLDRAKTIERKTLKAFVKQWAYTADSIMSDIGLIKSREVLDLMGSERTDSLTGMSTMLSEVYRSAFLRTLQYYYESGWVPDEYYLEYAYATLPVELSYWKIKPSRAPDWWPATPKTAEKDKTDEIHVINVETEITRIINQQGEFTILGLDGTVKPGAGWAGENLDTTVTLVAFGYQVLGPNIPDAEAVASEILYLPYVQSEPTDSRPFNSLETPDGKRIIGEFPVQVADLVIHPLVVRNRDLVISLWQWFRDYWGFFGLWPDLADKLDRQIMAESYGYLDKGTVVATSNHWLEGLTERQDKDLGIAAGTYIEATSPLINSHLQRHGLRLGYILKSTHKYRENRYQEAKVIDQLKLIGVSKIITV